MANKKTKTISADDLCECGHPRNMHTNIGCLDFEDIDDPKNSQPCPCMKFLLAENDGGKE